MKETINKRIYNTSTSKKIKTVLYYVNCNYCNVDVYQKRNGEFFLLVHGFNGTRYKYHSYLPSYDEYIYDEYYHNSIYGSGIIPLVNNEDIEYWINK